MEVARLSPDWSALPASPGKEEAESAHASWEFPAFDGGATNNEPLEHARLMLVDDDPVRRNPRGARTTVAATVLIDPFVAPDQSPASTAGELRLVDTIVAFVNALKNTARYARMDTTECVASTGQSFSRFLISPTWSDTERQLFAPRECAIASACLGGFGGFLHERFRHHDFMLGRRNCQRFLTQRFVLPVDHPLFAHSRERLLRDGHATHDRMLPIIPLVGDVRREQRLPDWPTGACDVSAFDGPLERRLNAVFTHLRWLLRNGEGKPGGSGGAASVPSRPSLFQRLVDEAKVALKMGLATIVWCFVAPWLRRRLLRAIKAGLERHRPRHSLAA